MCFPNVLTNGPYENRLFFAFGAEINSGMDRDDLVNPTAFVALSDRASPTWSTRPRLCSVPHVRVGVAETAVVKAKAIFNGESLPIIRGRLRTEALAEPFLRSGSWSAC